MCGAVIIDSDTSSTSTIIGFITKTMGVATSLRVERGRGWYGFIVGLLR